MVSGWSRRILAPRVQGMELVGTALPGSTRAEVRLHGAPDLCLTLHSSQLLQGTDVALVREGPQDISGHQQDQADRPGDH